MILLHRQPSQVCSREAKLQYGTKPAKQDFRTGHPMTLYFCGYFPKKVTPRPEGYDLPGVVEIASISDCIAKGPEDGIKSWKFNGLGFFDEADVARSLGFDVVSKAVTDFFECSPLSC